MKSEDVDKLVDQISPEQMKESVRMVFENDRVISVKPYRFDTEPIPSGFHLDMSKCIYK